ncbi:MAG: penicillin-binding protein 1A [Alphaproteobacteria bacterium]|nr:penicillin-binding protein 1A [Alphaproteobacteria bacterium]
MRYLWYAFLGLFSLGFVGLVAGVAGLYFAISYFGKDLPDYHQLKDYEPPIVTRLYAGDGRLLAEYAQEKRVFVPIDSIPPRVKNAFIAAEDQNFYRHKGVDMTAVARALVSNLKNMGSGRRPEGASTITQQVAKNFLLTNELSYKRKIKEAILAYRMDQAMNKDRILELYLNEIFLGARAYGVGAAALQYFNKSLDELTIAEAAFLAALPKAPNNYKPDIYHEKAVDRRNWVIDRMLHDGYIEQAEADLAKLSPLETVKQDKSQNVNAPFFAEEVRRELGQRYGQESLYGGGLVVRTTLDAKLQDISLKALRNGLMAYDQRHGWRGPYKQMEGLSGWKARLAEIQRPIEMLEHWKLAVVLGVEAKQASLGFADGEKGTLKLEDLKWAKKYLNEGYSQGPEVTGCGDVLAAGDVVMVEQLEGQENHYALRQVPLVQGAVVVMDPHTGRILAMQGGWRYRYGSSEYNRATQAKRQPGSAFKPFIYTAALENGFTPSSLVLDAPFVIEDRPGHFWSPTNYKEEYYGQTTIRVGIEKSRNLMTVRLAHHLGMDMVADYAERFGVVDYLPRHLANALGAAETTPLRMTAAYAVFVNGGKKIIPTIIDRVQDRRGKTIFKHDNRGCGSCSPLVRWDGQMVPDVPDNRPPVIDPRTAYQMVSIMEGVVQRGTAASMKDLGIPLAGKTGTTNKSKDSWFIGFSPDLVVGVFVGFDEPRSLGKRETGASVAVPVFKEFMKEALKDVPPMPFRIPPGIRNIQVNAETGRPVQAGDTNVIWESFVAGTEPEGMMDILDGSGVNIVPDEIYDDENAPEDAIRERAGPYTPAYNGSMATPPEEGYAPIMIPPDEAASGTGGLY